MPDCRAFIEVATTGLLRDQGARVVGVALIIVPRAARTPAAVFAQGEGFWWYVAPEVWSPATHEALAFNGLSVEEIQRRGRPQVGVTQAALQLARERGARELLTWDQKFTRSMILRGQKTFKGAVWGPSVRTWFHQKMGEHGALPEGRGAGVNRWRYPSLPEAMDFMGVPPVGDLGRATDKAWNVAQMVAAIYGWRGRR